MSRAVEMKHLLFLLAFFLLTEDCLGATVIPIELTKSSVQEITLIISAAALGLALLMLVLHGIRWITAENPEDIRQAKEGIIHVIAGILIVLTAAALVSMFYSMKPTY